MLNRAYQARVMTGPSWASADKAYGQNPAFRDWLADREIPFVLATRNDDLLTSPDEYRRPVKVLATIAGVGDRYHTRHRWPARRVGALAAGAPPEPTRRGQDGAGAGVLPLRRPRRHAAAGADPGAVAGARWATEECFQTAENEAGLDHYQVRTWRAWYAHITLSMLAHAWLAVARSAVAKGEPAPATQA
jgi:hypothetical protein